MRHWMITAAALALMASGAVAQEGQGSGVTTQTPQVPCTGDTQTDAGSNCIQNGPHDNSSDSTGDIGSDGPLEGGGNINGGGDGGGNGGGGNGGGGNGGGGDGGGNGGGGNGGGGGGNGGGGGGGSGG